MTEKKRKIGKGGPLAAMVVRRLGEITPEMVRDWRAAQIETGRVSQTSRAYDLMKSVLKTAVDDSILEKNPCQIRGGSTCRSTGSGTSRAPATRRPARLGYQEARAHA